VSSYAASLKRRPDEHVPRVRQVRAPALTGSPQPHVVSARPMRGTRMRRFAVLAVLVLIVAVAGGAWAVIPRATESGLDAHRQAVGLGRVSVLVPESWVFAQSRAGVPILEPPAAVLEPAPGLGAHVVVVLRPNGVPPDLRALIGPLGPALRTTLAGVPARFYTPPAPPDDQRAELTVARTSAGVLTVACIARVASWVAASGCAKEVSGSGSGLASAGDPPS
jgi:hypothetical protein